MSYTDPVSPNMCGIRTRQGSIHLSFNSPNLCGTPTNQRSMLLSLPTQYVCNPKVNIKTSRIDTTLEREGFSLIFYLGSNKSIVWKVQKEKAKGRRSHHLEAFVCILPERIGFKTCNT